MALFDVFKNKKGAREKSALGGKSKKAFVKKSVPLVKKEVKEKEAAVVPSRAKKESETAYRVLRGPHITEKANDLTGFNQYVFNVYRDAGKSEVKRTVQEIYGVDVIAVKIINIHPKKRRLGKIQGWKQGYKKAIVRLASGQKIELLPR